MADQEKTPKKTALNSQGSSCSALRRQLLKEAKSMSRYTMASGIKVSPNIFHTIEAFEEEQTPTLDIRRLVSVHV